MNCKIYLHTYTNVSYSLKREESQTSTNYIIPQEVTNTLSLLFPSFFQKLQNETRWQHGEMVSRASIYLIFNHENELQLVTHLIAFEKYRHSLLCKIDGAKVSSHPSNPIVKPSSWLARLVIAENRISFKERRDV